MLGSEEEHGKWCAVDFRVIWWRDPRPALLPPKAKPSPLSHAASEHTTTTCSANPWNICREGVRDALRAEGEENEGVRLEWVFIHTFRPFPGPKDSSVYVRRPLLVPLTHKDLLVFEALPPSQVKQQALTATATTSCLSSAHPWLGKDEIPSPPLDHSWFWWSWRYTIAKAVLQCDTANDQLIRQRGVWWI